MTFKSMLAWLGSHPRLKSVMSYKLPLDESAYRVTAQDLHGEMCTFKGHSVEEVMGDFEKWETNRPQRGITETKFRLPLVAARMLMPHIPSSGDFVYRGERGSVLGDWVIVENVQAAHHYKWLSSLERAWIRYMRQRATTDSGSVDLEVAGLLASEIISNYREGSVYFEVKFTVEKVGDRMVGPYGTLDEARENLLDIAGFDRVSNARILLTVESTSELILTTELFGQAEA